MPRPRNERLVQYFKISVSGKVLCFNDECGGKSLNLHAANLERHMRRFHFDKYTEYQIAKAEYLQQRKENIEASIYGDPSDKINEDLYDIIEIKNEPETIDLCDYEIFEKKSDYDSDNNEYERDENDDKYLEHNDETVSEDNQKLVSKEQINKSLDPEERNHYVLEIPRECEKRLKRLGEPLSNEIVKKRNSQHNNQDSSSIMMGQDCENQDEDYHFMMSILPTMRELPKLNKLVVRSKIQQLLCEQVQACMKNKLNQNVG